MTDNGLYYALSTLAQCAAALAALIGFLGLWRLDRLKQEHDQVERDLRGLLAGVRIADLAVNAYHRDFIIQQAEDLVARPGDRTQLALKVDASLKQWRVIPVEQRRLMTTLKVFLAVTLVIVLAPAIIGIAHVKQLENLGWPPMLIYMASAWLAGAPVWVVEQAARSTAATQQG
jgi:hypothetical protein